MNQFNACKFEEIFSKIFCINSQNKNLTVRLMGQLLQTALFFSIIEAESKNSNDKFIKHAYLSIKKVITEKNSILIKYMELLINNKLNLPTFFEQIRACQKSQEINNTISAFFKRTSPDQNQKYMIDNIAQTFNFNISIINNKVESIKFYQKNSRNFVSLIQCQEIWYFVKNQANNLEFTYLNNNQQIITQICEQQCKYTQKIKNLYTIPECKHQICLDCFDKISGKDTSYCTKLKCNKKFSFWEARVYFQKEESLNKIAQNRQNQMIDSCSNNRDQKCIFCNKMQQYQSLQCIHRFCLECYNKRLVGKNWLTCYCNKILFESDVILIKNKLLIDDQQNTKNNQTKNNLPENQIDMKGPRFNCYNCQKSSEKEFTSKCNHKYCEDCLTVQLSYKQVFKCRCGQQIKRLDFSDLQINKEQENCIFCQKAFTQLNIYTQECGHSICKNCIQNNYQDQKEIQCPKQRCLGKFQLKEIMNYFNIQENKESEKSVVKKNNYVDIINNNIPISFKPVIKYETCKKCFQKYESEFMIHFIACKDYICLNCVDYYYYQCKEKVCVVCRIPLHQQDLSKFNVQFEFNEQNGDIEQENYIKNIQKQQESSQNKQSQDQYIKVQQEDLQIQQKNKSIKDNESKLNQQKPIQQDLKIQKDQFFENNNSGSDFYKNQPEFLGNSQKNNIESFSSCLLGCNKKCDCQQNLCSQCLTQLYKECNNIINTFCNKHNNCQSCFLEASDEKCLFCEKYMKEPKSQKLELSVKIFQVQHVEKNNQEFTRFVRNVDSKQQNLRASSVCKDTYANKLMISQFRSPEKGRSYKY